MCGGSPLCYDIWIYYAGGFRSLIVGEITQERSYIISTLVLPSLTGFMFVMIGFVYEVTCRGDYTG